MYKIFNYKCCMLKSGKSSTVLYLQQQVGITDISGPRQFGTATIRHPRRRFGSSVPTVRELGTDSSGVGLK